MREVSQRVQRSALDLEEKHEGERSPCLSGCLLAGVLAAASFAPLPVVLPVVSVILVQSGCVIATYSWFRSERRDASVFTCWDQAGLFMFAGFIAALICDSTEALNFIETFANRPPRPRVSGAPDAKKIFTRTQGNCAPLRLMPNEGVGRGMMLVGG
jgi:hypothetical protein